MISLFLDSQPGMILPNHPLAWLGWLVMAALLGWGIWRWRENLDILRERWWLLLALLLLTPIFTGFIGVRLPGEVQAMPETPLEVAPPALMFLAALPWILAAGFLETTSATALGMLSGLILGMYETRSPFTPLEIGGLALLFSVAIRQNYRTPFYRLLRHPLVAALAVTVLYAPVLVVTMLLEVNGSLAARLDYAFTQVWLILAARLGENIIAGLSAEMIHLALPALWGRKRQLIPSPAESSIQSQPRQWTVVEVSLPLSD